MTMLVRTTVLKAVALLGGGLLLGILVVLARGTGKGSSPEAGQGAQDQPKRLGDELEARSRAVILRLRRKERLVQRLLAGKLTLLETAAHFRALDRAPPPFNWQQFRCTQPGDSDEERHCRQVIGFVRAVLSHDGSLVDTKPVERLEAELREHLCRDTLRLPEVAPLADEAEEQP